MSKEYLRPGVFVEEIPSGSFPLEGVGTSTAAFIGIAGKGALNTPKLITNWTQFVRHFGSYRPDSYLAYAVLLGAGLKGIEEGYELPPGSDDDVWALSNSERRALGMAPLPSSLNQAIQAMERSELVAEILGEHVFDFFLRNKRAEWEDYRRQVTLFELDRYLPIL